MSLSLTENGIHLTESDLQKRKTTDKLTEECTKKQKEVYCCFLEIRKKTIMDEIIDAISKNNDIFPIDDEYYFTFDWLFNSLGGYFWLQSNVGQKITASDTFENWIKQKNFAFLSGSKNFAKWAFSTGSGFRFVIENPRLIYRYSKI